MDSEQWLKFTIFTGIDKFKAEIARLCKDSKKLKDSFDYMRLISTIYVDLDCLMDEVKSIL